RLPVRTAMSSRVTIPARSSPSTTGSRRIPCWTISAAASSRSMSGSPVTSGRDACLRADSERERSSARTRIVRSLSVIIAAGSPSGSQSTTEPTLWSRISWATSSRSASGPAVTTPLVMISRSCIGARTVTRPACRSYEPGSRGGHRRSIGCPQMAETSPQTGPIAVYGPSGGRAGVALVTAMGFDYLPGDMLAALTAEGMGSLEEIVLAYAVRGFGATRGTALSALGMMAGGEKEWRDGELGSAGRSVGAGSWEFPDPIGRQRMVRYPAGEHVTVPRHVRTQRVRILLPASTVIPLPLVPRVAPL